MRPLPQALENLFLRRLLSRSLQVFQAKCVQGQPLQRGARLEDLVKLVGDVADVH